MTKPSALRSAFPRIAWLLAGLALAGCGGSSGKAVNQLTVPSYGGYPAKTIPVTAGTPALCRRDAQAFTREAVSFLHPLVSPADYAWVAPDDQPYFMARLQFADFEAHRCHATYLRKALSRRLSAKERRTLVAGLGFLGEIGRDLTKSPRT